MDVIMFDSRNLPEKVAVPIIHEDDGDLCIVLCADHLLTQVAQRGLPDGWYEYTGDHPCYICGGGTFEA